MNQRRGNIREPLKDRVHTGQKDEKHQGMKIPDEQAKRGTFDNGTQWESVEEVSKGAQEYVVIGGECPGGGITGELSRVCMG